MRLLATGHPGGRAWTVALRQVARRRSVILGYHGVSEAPHEEDQYRLQLPPAMFRTQLEMLRAGGFRFVTVAEFARATAEGPPPPGLAAVSFDDGLRNNLTTALPILRRLGAPATIYVPTGWIGGQHPELGPTADGAILTREEIRELAREGWEIGAHTASHCDLSLLDYARCRAEVTRSCEELTQLTGMPVRTFAYPFGRYGRAALAAARDCGLIAAVAAETKTWRPYELTRIMVGGADPLRALLLKLVDRYEWYSQSAPVRALHACRRYALTLTAGR